MTISEIKRRVINVPLFFEKRTLRIFGQTMASFKVKKAGNGKYRVSAPIRWEGKVIGETVRIFNPETNEFEFED